MSLFYIKEHLWPYLVSTTVLHIFRMMRGLSSRGRISLLQERMRARRGYLETTLSTLAVVSILTELEGDAETLAAAMLHDVVEDTPVKLRRLEVSSARDRQARRRVTKLSRIEFRSHGRAGVNLRKMFLAMAEDWRVVVIRLADRLHNLRTLDPCLRTGRRPPPGRPWISTLRWLTASVSGASSGNWRTCHLSTSCPRSTSPWPSSSRHAGRSGKPALRP